MTHLLKKNQKTLKFLRLVGYLILLVLLMFGTKSYSGNKFLYLIFSIPFIYLIFFAFRKRAIFFDTFFSILLFLGFWFKFTMIISFTDGVFREGVGNFDYSPKNFDMGLMISTVGILPFILLGHLREKFFVYPSKINLMKNKNLNYGINRPKILFIFLMIVISVFLLNAFFRIYQKGLIPITEINFFFSGFIKWALIFGLTTFSSVIIFLEFSTFRKIFNLTILISILEIFLSSISMISRGMIFNSASLIYGIYILSKKTNRWLTIKKLMAYIFLVVILFYISVILVNYLRVNYFYVGKSVIETIKKKQVDKKEIINQKKIDTVNKFDIIDLNNEFVYLIINRWVGIDSALVVAQNKNILSKSLLVEALNEKPNIDSPTFYEKTFFLENQQSYGVQQYINVKGNTLTGIITFLFYSGSFYVLFFGMLLLCFFASCIEILSFRISNYNLIFSALIGQIIAFRYIHFGYLPSQSYLLFGSIIITLVLVYIFTKKKFH
jgi:hypothetical protein